MLNFAKEHRLRIVPANDCMHCLHQFILGMHPKLFPVVREKMMMIIPSLWKQHCGLHFLFESQSESDSWFENWTISHQYRACLILRTQV